MTGSGTGAFKPTIALSTWRRRISIAPYGDFEVEAVITEYIAAVHRAGGIAVLLPHSDPADAEAALAGADGLVLVGGDDVDPAHYGQENTGSSRHTHRELDAFEIELVRVARARRLPTLAICRGLQILNTSLGGTLHQDLAGGELTHLSPAETAAHAEHPVQIHGDGCLLSRMYGDSVAVNSIHHQGIDRLGDHLRAVAKAHDGLIEGVESLDATWPLIGVQWHPEKLENGSPLFAWLTDTATQNRTISV